MAVVKTSLSQISVTVEEYPLAVILNFCIEILFDSQVESFADSDFLLYGHPHLEKKRNHEKIIELRNLKVTLSSQQQREKQTSTIEKLSPFFICTHIVLFTVAVVKTSLSHISMTVEENSLAIILKYSCGWCQNVIVSNIRDCRRVSTDRRT